MTPSINVSQSIMDELAGMAKPFVDREPQDVIKRLIEHFRSSAVLTHGDSANAGGSDEGEKVFAPDSPPDLSFTRVKSFELDGQQVVKKAELYWNPILFAIVARVAKKLGTDELKKRLLVNFVNGEGQQETGYRFIQEAGLSVQGSNANTVWKAIFELVRALGVKMDVEFVWEDKPKAAFPNTTGRFSYNGK